MTGWPLTVALAGDIANNANAGGEREDPVREQMMTIYFARKLPSCPNPMRSPKDQSDPELMPCRPQ